jgi:hypothetical protein
MRMALLAPLLTLLVALLPTLLALGWGDGNVNIGGAA